MKQEIIERGHSIMGILYREGNSEGKIQKSRNEKCEKCENREIEKLENTDIVKYEVEK